VAVIPCWAFGDYWALYGKNENIMCNNRTLLSLAHYWALYAGCNLITLMHIIETLLVSSILLSNPAIISANNLHYC
jgi:hypothetical protein